MYGVHVQQSITLFFCDTHFHANRFTLECECPFKTDYNIHRPLMTPLRMRIVMITISYIQHSLSLNQDCV